MDQGFTNVQQAPGAGGICGTHGVFDGRGCPQCARTKALAALRQAAWDATQFLSEAEVSEYVDGVMGEVRSDEP